MKKFLIMFLVLGILLFSKIGIAKENSYFYKQSSYHQINRILVIDRLVDPSREAKILAQIIKNAFYGKELKEIVMLKPEEGEFILIYLIKAGKIIDTEGKPLDIEQARDIFKHNPKVWEAVLLQFYYEVSKYFGKENKDTTLKNISFGNFVTHLYKEGKISLDTAFMAGMMGKIETPLMKELFQEIPQAQKLEIKPMVFKYGKEDLKEVILQNTGDNFVQAVAEKKIDLGDSLREDNDKKNIYLKIDLLGRGVRFLGLVISTIGNTVVSSQGVISYFTEFSKNIELTLADVLKMVVKGIKAVLPSLEIPPKPLLPIPNMHPFYFPYIFIIVCFWLAIRKLQQLDWDLAFARGEKSLQTFYSKGRNAISQSVKPVEGICSKTHKVISQTASKVKDEKKKLKILIKVPHYRNEKNTYYSRSNKWNNRALEGLEEDLNRRLNRIKYWADYLANIKNKS
ncbi:MAG: hypothetical protein AB7E08_03935 [Candidatus Omnitrophota bacterium]